MLTSWNKRLFFAFPLSAGLLASAALVASGATAATSPQTKSTKSYVFKLSLGMAEQMWTPAQVRAQHPKTGEVMLTGSMMAGAMSMGRSQRHLEVHITSRATDKVVMGAHPTMSAIDANVKNAMMIKVPVATMEGVITGAVDMHYGNNVALVAGHTYRVTITLKGEHVAFQIKSPTA
jgi:hypothetical protein